MSIDWIPETKTYRFSDTDETLVFDLAAKNTADGRDGLHVIGNGKNNHIIGDANENSLSGGKGDDILNGGGGNDTLVGGQGNDYFTITEGDTLTEHYGEGRDTVVLAAGYSVDYILQDNFENVEIDSTDDIDVIGNFTDNFLKGGDGNNSLSGDFGKDTLVSSAGIDTLAGGYGDDVYEIDDDTDDILEEEANGGTDTVVTSRDLYTLLEHFENLTLKAGGGVAGNGNDANNVITGNEKGNVLEGKEGNDTLDGGAGGDTLAGGEDSDWYRIDGNDEVMEDPDEGYDTVEVSFDNYTLGANLEALKLKDGVVTASGNGLSNYILGNGSSNQLHGGAGYDVLDGGAGADTMHGGADSDTYIIDSTQDVAVEAAGAGEDLIVTLIDYTLSAGAHVEKLEAAYIRTGLKLAGNAFNNRVTGALGADYIDGDRGADLMQGKAGDDTFIVDNALDMVEELTAEGHDTVLTSINYRLADNAEIENLSASSLSAKKSLSLTGNAYANTIIGHAGKNKLIGGYGNDTFFGRNGKDSFVFNTKLNAKQNVDRIGDFNITDDTIQLSRSIFSKIKKGKLKKDAFWIGSKSHDKTDRIIYNDKKGVLYYDADGSGKGKAVQFAKLSKKLKMTEADFHII